MTTREQLPFKGLTPAARPVDTYSRPAERGVMKPNLDNPLLQLGEALKWVNPKIDSFLLASKKEQEETATNYGYSLNANRENFNGFMDRLKKEDPDRYEQIKGMNPHVEIGFNRAHLEGQGLVYSTALAQALTENPTVEVKDAVTGQPRQVSLFESKDPTVIHGWMNTHLQKWMTENGMGNTDTNLLMEAFYPRVQAAQAQLANRRAVEFQNEYHDKLLQQTQENVTATITGLAGSLSWETAQQRDTSAQAIAARLNGVLKNATSNGYRDFEKLNQHTLTSIIAAAEQASSQPGGKDQAKNLLEIAKHVETSPGSFLGRAGWAMDKLTQAEINIEKRTRYLEEVRRDDLRWANYLEDQQWSRVVRAHTVKEWGDSDNERALRDNRRGYVMHLTTKVMEDPTKNWVDDPALKSLAKLDPGAAAGISAFQQQWLGMKETAQVDDKESLGRLLRDVNTQGSVFDTNRITQAFNSGLITKDSLKQLWDDWRRAKEDAADPFLMHQEFKSMVSGLRQAVSKDPEGNGYGPSAYDAAVAERALRRKARVWKAQNSGKSFDEFMDTMEVESGNLLKKYNAEAATDAKSLNNASAQSPLDRAVIILRQNPSPEMKAMFERNFPGQRADDYLRQK
ncbi:MAG: hypothetical protein FD119_3726 [Stygiobacter sp.]|nr:MAG: hypothetical protein FD119_3726 [Stygiobacter sp.]